MYKSDLYIFKNEALIFQDRTPPRLMPWKLALAPLSPLEPLITPLLIVDLIKV